MARLLLLLTLLALILLLAACGQAEQTAGPEPTTLGPTGATPTSSPVALQPTSSPVPVSPTSLPAATSAPTATATATAAATDTPIPTASATATAPEPTQTTAPPTSTEAPTPTPTSPPPPTPTATAAIAPDPGQVRLELELVADNLDRPLGIVNAGDGSGRLFILEKPGRIRILRQGTVVDGPFLDLTDRVGSSGSEQGLLGLAFHPRYPENGRFFVDYTNRDGDTIIAEYQVTADPGRADPGSQRVLLRLDQPAANHNGGHLVFGPDGYLYIGTGDGGASGDRFGNAQNGQTLLGAMLRLDVDGEQPYGIPPDNPFVGNASIRDEIWAIGLRNPWRYSFDRLTGALYIADVGQNMYEEVNYQVPTSPGGENYGWPIMEGLHCYPADRPCDRSGLVLPVREYDHSLGCSITGGYVYRGQQSPGLNGIYFFGDYCSGIIWGLAATSEGDWLAARLADTGARISSFGEGEAGELYLADIAGGTVYHLVGTPRQ